MATTTKKSNKTRLNLGIEPGCVRAGRAMARTEKRSFSNFIEWLISQEAARRESEQKQAA